jgi:hypothetical protein
MSAANWPACRSSSRVIESLTSQKWIMSRVVNQVIGSGLLNCHGFDIQPGKMADDDF